MGCRLTVEPANSPEYIALMADLRDVWTTKFTQARIIPTMMPATKSHAPMVTIMMTTWEG